MAKQILNLLSLFLINSKPEAFYFTNDSVKICGAKYFYRILKLFEGWTAVKLIRGQNVQANYINDKLTNNLFLNLKSLLKC